MLDLEPATRMLTGLVEGVRDDQLNEPTPCVKSSLGDLLDHVDGLSLAFTAAGTKIPLPGASQAPTADGSRLDRLLGLTGRDLTCQSGTRHA